MRVIIVLTTLLCSAIGSFAWKGPSTSDVILSNGYPVEVFKVETRNGYIVTLHRIPYSRNGTISQKRPPVLLQHGFLCSSACWVLSDPSKGLGYRLSEAGYDVWLSNDRGTIYSREHKELDPKSAQFWDFSFEDMGMYDLPAVIDFILGKTGETQLTFVGHSQGTMQYFVMQSTHPEYNEKIKVASLMAPIAYIINERGLLPAIAKISTPLSYLADIFGTKHVLDPGFIEHMLGHTVCSSRIFHFLCDEIFFIISGFDSPQLNRTLVKSITDHCPAGCSIKQLKHFAQLINNGGKFTMYDYGIVGNEIVYSSISPPEFDLSKSTAPVKIYYSYGDYLSTAPGVQEMMKILPNAEKFSISDYKFNHVDFMWASDINELLYDELITIIKKYL